MAQLQRVTSLSFSEANNFQGKSEISKENGYINPAFSAVHIPNLIPEKEQVPLPLEDSFEGMDGHLDSNGNGFSALPSKGEDAIVVVNACKSFKYGSKTRPVLENFCMTVKQGTIYSLLGSSGCGKTTLLNCVVGMTLLDSGRILIFGRRTGTVASGVPGKRIGFMPQETALYRDFTIKETITYFGSLYGMKSAQIEESREELMNLLNLPEGDRRVSTLSGGQKRRVSLAVTLVHKPEILILDEPTVGVDYLLRETIWKHLMKLVSTEKKTVIITTHYIEEARNSDTVGVMRGGRLLTEKSPALLLDEFKTHNLEEVVLKLCHEDEKGSLGFGRERSLSGNVKVTVDRKYSQPLKKALSFSPSIDGQSHDWQPLPSLAEQMSDSLIRIKSLIMKNGFVMLRNIFLVLFVILLPSMQTIVMGFSMGNDPKPIKVGVVNYDYNYTGGCSLDEPANATEGCEITNLSCRFLRTLPPDTIQLSYYGNEEDARDDIKQGKIRSFMTFLPGYSDAMYERSASSIAIDNDTLHDSMILFEMDASNAIVTKTLQRIIYETYENFVRGLLSSCGLNPELGGLPIKFQNPIYGAYDLALREYIAAGMLVGVALFFPLCSSSITYIWDKKQGTMERARVAGTQTWEIMMSYFATEGIVLCFQSLLSFLILIFIFKIPIIGSPFLAVLLLLLNGLAGISLGLLIASFCKEEIQAILLGLAIIFPNFFLAGSMWPVEGMPMVLQYLSYGLPGTLACEAFRSIVVRGWGFSHFYVWIGFVSTTAWLLFYCLLGIFITRFTLRK